MFLCAHEIRDIVSSLVSSPAFKLGNTYTVKTKGYERTFTLNEPFTTVLNQR